MCLRGAASMGEELCNLGCQQDVAENVRTDSRGGGRKRRGGVYGDGFEGPATAFGKSPFMEAFEERGKLATTTSS